MDAQVVGAADLLPAVAEQLRPVGVLVGHRKVVEDVAVLRPGALLPAAQADGLDRVLVLHHPGTHVEEVDVLFDVEVAAQQGEVVPVAHLPDHVGPTGLARLDPDAAAVVVRLQAEDVADRAAVDAPHHLAEAVVVPQAQAGDDRQVFRLGPLAGGQHGADAGRVHRHRFFGEHVLVGLDRRRQVQRAEMWRRAQQHHVARVDDVLIGVEAGEALVGGHVELARKLVVPFECVEALLNAVREGIAHRYEFDLLIRLERLGGGSCAAATAAD